MAIIRVLTKRKGEKTMAKFKKIEKKKLWEIKRALTDRELDHENMRFCDLGVAGMKARIKRITNPRKLLALMKVAGEWKKFGIREAARTRLFIVTGNV
jgi:hypothetical protein